VWVAAGEEPPVQQRVKCSRIVGCVLMPPAVCFFSGGLFAMISGRLQGPWVVAIVFTILGMALAMLGILLLVECGGRHTHE